MFRYFPDNMMWSQAVLIALNSGGDINEVDEACRQLAGHSSPPDVPAWYTAWKALADKVRHQAETAEHEGHLLSAANKYRRACAYYIVTERVLDPQDPRKVSAYEDLRNSFARFLDLSRASVERVEVPYEDASLPALFAPAPGEGPHPALIFVDGFDIMKEIIYLRRIEEAHRRGISLFIVDTPGVGEALRLRHMPTRYDTEAPVSACVDYLQSRQDVDADRIGIIGISLGGYYAPRAAAFEHRLKCCIGWGAIWDAGQVFRPLYAGTETNRTAPTNQLTWVTGTSSIEEGLAYFDRMTLDGVAERITCPLLVVHGEHDHLVPTALAERTVQAATNSPRAELRVFREDEGGDQHCQMDNMGNCLDFIYDWAADVLGAATEPNWTATTRQGAEVRTHAERPNA